MRKNLVKFGRVRFVLCEQTDRQTNRHSDHNKGGVGEEVVMTMTSVVGMKQAGCKRWLAIACCLSIT